MLTATAGERFVKISQRFIDSVSLMLKRHILFVPDGDFTASDIDEVIRSMCNDWCFML